MPKTDNNEWKYESNSNAICPYCDSIFENEDFLIDQEGNHEVHCPDCDKKYDVETAETIYFTYSTFKKEI